LAANQGDAVAQIDLGDCYYEGKGVKQDYKLAVKYYQLAADREFAYAQNNLGKCY
jgi:TPR repeat protein